MPASIGVLAVHGMGTFSPEKPDSVLEPEYSKKLFENVRDRFGVDFDKHVVWREAFYSHVFDKNQERFIERTKNQVSYHFLRKLAVSNLGDPGSYHGGSASSGNTVYKAVNASVEKSLEALRKRLAPGSPIVIIAHSLGGHVVSNTIWDMQDKSKGVTPGDVAAIVTIGCNLSLFLFGEDPKGITAIKYPGSALPPSKRPKTWWRNYFDRNDPLGFPIGPTGGDYEKMAKEGALIDKQVDVGWPIVSMTALSHVAYWGDRDIAVRVNNLLQLLR